MTDEKLVAAVERERQASAIPVPSVVIEEIAFALMDAVGDGVDSRSPYRVFEEMAILAARIVEDFHQTARLAVHAEADELLRAIAAVNFADGLIQLVDSGIDLAHLIQELVEIQADSDAAIRTGILRVRFGPSERFRNLVATTSRR